MKFFTYISLFLLLAGAAHAQLDHIFSPLPATAEIASAPQAAVAPAAAVPDRSVSQVADHHRDLSGDEVLAEIQKQLASYFGIKGDLKLSFTSTWKSLRLPDKDFDLGLIDYPPDGVTGSFGIKFKITSGGAPAGEWQVSLRAQLWQSVWVAQERLDRGQVLDRSMLRTQKMDVLREQQTLLSEDVDPAAYDVAQSIGPGRAIGKKDIVERPLVHKGAVVEVVASHGLLDIHMKALALEDGGLNALIKLRNLDSNKDFSAQILNENQVKVQF